MNPEVTIRPYVPADLDRVLEITVDSFAEASIERRIDRQFPDAKPSLDWAERKRGEVAADFDRHPDGCFVAVAAGLVVGYVTTSVHPERSQGRIPNLAVDARYRGRGIGRRLVEWALADFRSRGLRLARIETLADNAVGNHLYPSLGFQEVVRQVHFALQLD